ncbi:MAG: bifunctional homocysteine S-methyltransferase/methylenetetrahydrofolate reductase, partial [Candidatus Zixiibacteriota bacterium]
GAEIIETNSFGGNRFRLATHGLENSLRDINIKAAKIARETREISGVDVYIAGSMGPLGKPIEPFGKITLEDAQEAFREQAEALLEGGVDLFMIETISRVDEMVAAIEAVKSVSDLPIAAQVTFTTEGSTYFGSSPADMVQKLLPLDVDVIGANCSVGPQKMLEVIEQLVELGVPYISAQPNAGLPKYFGGRFIYLSSPDYFADYARLFARVGTRIIGGCCGTTPEHIKKVAAITGDTIDRREKTRIKEIEKKAKKLVIPAGGTSTTFTEKLKKGFVVSVEIDPPKGTNPAKMIQAAKDLKQAGADAVNIADSPMARVRMSCMASANLIQAEVDIDIILHYTTRDRNLMGLQSDLIGAHATGIRNILALTGDPPSLGDYPQATAVYDVDSIGLIKIISNLNAGVDFAGNSIGKPTQFSIGVAANPASNDINLEIERLHQKIEAGGQYIMTQPLYDLETFEKFLDKKKNIKVPLILGILPLVSYKHAQFLHNEVPGITIPEDIRDKMNSAGENSAYVGAELATEFIEKTRNLMNGVYIMPSFGRFESSIDIIKSIKRK